MSVSFDGIKVGDRVRLTRIDGNVSEFTVTEVKGGMWITSATNDYHDSQWDTVEVLSPPKPPLPTAEGIYVFKSMPAEFASTLFALDGGQWYSDAADQLRQASQAWAANGKPRPEPNSGGRLLRYFTRGITDLYAWADKDYKPGEVVPELPDRPLAAVIDITSATRSNT